MKNDTPQAPANNTPSASVDPKTLVLKTGVKAGGLLLPAVQKIRAA